MYSGLIPDVAKPKDELERYAAVRMILRLRSTHYSVSTRNAGEAKRAEYFGEKKKGPIPYK
jgi:hypothetical protein